MRAAATRLLVGVLVVAFATSAAAVPIVVTNADGPGEGFNDQTPVDPVGGNTGTTLGAQRLQAFNFAADVWARQLVSNVTVRVTAVMNPLDCNSTSATLGEASPASLFRDFDGALMNGTWYASALANKLAGQLLASGNPDIQANFNSAIGTTCSFSQTWYYGLDANPPPNAIDFVSVVAHELAHGLGFETFVDETTGQKFMGFDDPFEQRLVDDGVFWPGMSDAERKASAIHTGHLRFDGPATRAAAPATLTSGADASGRVLMYAPNPVQQGSSVSHFDVTLTPSQLLEPFYTHPIHTTSLTRDVLADIGWGTDEPTATSTTIVTSTTLATTTTTLVLSCPPAPTPGCRAAAPGESTLSIVKAAAKRRNRLHWLWKGTDTSVADFRNPTAATSKLQLCLYDASTAAQPLLSAAIPAGNQCGAAVCWRPLGKAANPSGYRFRDRSGFPDGVVMARLRVSGTNGARILVNAKGASLSAPSLGIALPVTMQLLAADGGGTTCWETSFGEARRNDARSFAATGP